MTDYYLAHDESEDQMAEDHSDSEEWIKELGRRKNYGEAVQATRLG